MRKNSVAEIDSIKKFYGIEKQKLESLLKMAETRAYDQSPRIEIEARA